MHVQVCSEFGEMSNAVSCHKRRAEVNHA
jgi:hypothetical protein